MQFKAFFIPILLVSLACNNNVHSTGKENNRKKAGSSDNPYVHLGDIPLPDGFIREDDSPDPFARFLRNIALKKDRTVYQFNGCPKTNQLAQFAVLDISVGNKDLQQCADAVMRLRAEYLFATGKYGQINFIDNEGTVYKFTPPYSRENFTKYLQRVFGMCGSASLAKQLKSVEFSDIRPGDVLIRGGFPGHAVIVMNIAVNAAGEKIYLLAQSYMPAQDIHILVNPANKNLSPWYSLNDNKRIQTPEYLFYSNELKRW